MALPSAPRFAYALARDLLPDDVRVESQSFPSAPGALPLVVAGTSAPVQVPNDPRVSTSVLTISYACYADTADEALDLATVLYGRIQSAWRSGYRNDYGWLASVGRDSLQPHRVASALEADDQYRFDVLMSTIVRA